jgi:hypothetical protein
MADSEPQAVEQFYGILAFIPEGSDFDFDAAIDRLREAFPRREVGPVAWGEDRAVEIAAKRWSVEAVLAEQPYVANESREMAEWHRDHPRAAEIAGCRRRVEFLGTDVRPGSKCHADMLRACRVFGSFSGVIVFDLERGQLVSE